MSKPQALTTFEPDKIIQPIYTGGDVATDITGRILATCLGEDVILTDYHNGDSLGRIEGVSAPPSSCAGRN